MLYQIKLPDIDKSLKEQFLRQNLEQQLQKNLIVANGKLYVVGADFGERFCRPTKMLEKGAEAQVLLNPHCDIQIVSNRVKCFIKYKWFHVLCYFKTIM